MVSLFTTKILNNMTNEQIAEKLAKECGITAPYDSLKKLVAEALELKDRQEERKLDESKQFARKLMCDKFLFTRKNVYDYVAKTIGWRDGMWVNDFEQLGNDWKEKYELLESRLKDSEERERIGVKIINELRKKLSDYDKK